MQISPALRNHQARPQQQGNAALPPPKQDVRPSENGFVQGVRATGELLMDSASFAFNELTELGRNDPALAMRLGATTISGKLLEGVDQQTKLGFDKAIVPTIRAGLLGLNLYRAHRTFSDPRATGIEKGMDGLRVATDVLGLAGGLLRVAVPGWAAAGDTMVGVAYAADTVSHAVRGMTHGAERVQVWKKMNDESKKKRLADTPPQQQIPYHLADAKPASTSMPAMGNT